MRLLEPQRGDFVSTQHVHEHEAPAGGSPAGREVEAFFQKVADAGPQPRMRGLSGICQFNIEGAGIWQATIKKGVITLARGADADAAAVTCTIRCDAADFVRMASREGNLNVFAAALQELFTISGDLTFAWAVLGSFILDPADASSR
jgi:hypothetical protein